MKICYFRLGPGQALLLMPVRRDWQIKFRVVHTWRFWHVRALLTAHIAKARCVCHLGILRAINSAVECYLHKVEVTGSNPVSPTITFSVNLHRSISALLRGFNKNVMQPPKKRAGCKVMPDRARFVAIEGDYGQREG